MGELRSRAVAFLARPRIIFRRGTGPDYLVERYLAGEPWDDPESRALLARGIETARLEAQQRERAAIGPSRDAWNFYQAAARLLQDIQAEVAAAQGGV